MDKTKKEKTAYHVEIAVVILLGITALLTAWASWIGGLHAGNQATNYTTSNNLASEGNAEYNAATQSLMQDMILWNDIADMQLDLQYAIDTDDSATAEQISTKMYHKLNENVSEDMANMIMWTYPDVTSDYTTTIWSWLDAPEAWNTPFGDEEFVATYFVTANELLEQSNAILEQGKEDNKDGDAFGLVTVIFSVSLFLLGIIGTIKNEKNRYILLGISIVSVLLATIYMLTLPLPTGFNLFGFV